MRLPLESVTDVTCYRQEVGKSRIGRVPGYLQCESFWCADIVFCMKLGRAFLSGSGA